MQLWPVFLTGLLAGGASCAAVQGGLLTGLLARRTDVATAAVGATAGRRRPQTAAPNRMHTKKTSRPATAVTLRTATRAAPVRPTRDWREDAAPVGGFLAGKLASHALLGLLLGALGDAVQLGFRTRAVTQGVAGVVMILLALHLFGVRGLGFLVPQPPASLGRLVRRSARSQAMAAPTVLGLLTVFIPCGVTLGVMFLAVASGSPLAGMLILSVFVLGTFPLFAALGYAAARWAAALGGKVATATAVVVLAVGVYTLNGGLTLGGAPVNAGKLVYALSGPAAAAPVAATAPAPVYGPVAQGPAAGPQEFEIEVFDSDYRTPASIRAGQPTVVTLVTDGTRGCTRGFVVPSLGIEQILPETGRTEVDLGVLEPGRLDFTCSMGMYGGTLDVVA
jgi:sulfite exporter TauE/SafE